MCATGTLPVASQIRIARRTETASRHCRQRRANREVRTRIVRPSVKSLIVDGSVHRSEINALNVPVLLCATPLPTTRRALSVSIAGFMATPKGNADASRGGRSTRFRYARLTTEQETSSRPNSGHSPRPRASCRPLEGARNSATSRYLAARESMSRVPSREFPYAKSSPLPTENASGPKQFASVG